MYTMRTHTYIYNIHMYSIHNACMISGFLKYSPETLTHRSCCRGGVNSTTGSDLTTCATGRCRKMKSFGDDETAEELQETTKVST